MIIEKNFKTDHNSCVCTYQTGVLLVPLTSHVALLRRRKRLCAGRCWGRSPEVHLQRKQRGRRAVTISWPLSISVSTRFPRLFFWRGTKSPVTELSFTLYPFCPRDKMLNKYTHHLTTGTIRLFDKYNVRPQSQKELVYRHTKGPNLRLADILTKNADMIQNNITQRNTALYRRAGFKW